MPEFSFDGTTLPPDPIIPARLDDRQREALRLRSENYYAGAERYIQPLFTDPEQFGFLQGDWYELMLSRARMGLEIDSGLTQYGYPNTSTAKEDELNLWEHIKIATLLDEVGRVNEADDEFARAEALMEPNVGYGAEDFYIASARGRFRHGHDPIPSVNRYLSISRRGFVPTALISDHGTAAILLAEFGLDPQKELDEVERVLGEKKQDPQAILFVANIHGQVGNYQRALDLLNIGTPESVPWGVEKFCAEYYARKALLQSQMGVDSAEAVREALRRIKNIYTIDGVGYRSTSSHPSRLTALTAQAVSLSGDNPDELFDEAIRQTRRNPMDYDQPAPFHLIELGRLFTFWGKDATPVLTKALNAGKKLNTKTGYMHNFFKWFIRICSETGHLNLAEFALDTSEKNLEGVQPQDLTQVAELQLRLAKGMELSRNVTNTLHKPSGSYSY